MMQQFTISCTSVILFLIGCSAGDSFLQRDHSRAGEVGIPASSEFEQLWEQRTITLGGFGGAGRSLLLGAPSMGGGGDDAFPLLVRATLMDSALVEAGIREFARLARMSDEELQAYRARYAKEHGAENHINVWVQITTPFAENYLKPDRWTIFLEDKEKHQIEPDRIVEHPAEKTPSPTGGERAQNREGIDSQTMRQGSMPARSLELFFPLFEFGAQVDRLKLVVVDTSDPNVRAEGTWDLSKLQTRKGRQQGGI
jgi:hypothetical protein